MHAAASVADMPKLRNAIPFIVVGLYGLLQFGLAVATFSRALPPALFFLASGICLLLGLIMRNSVAVVIGLVLSMVGPLIIGLSGLEPFELIHHVVRAAVVTVIALIWFLGRRANRETRRTKEAA